MEIDIKERNFKRHSWNESSPYKKNSKEELGRFVLDKSQSFLFCLSGMCHEENVVTEDGGDSRFEGKHMHTGQSPQSRTVCRAGGYEHD